MFGIETAEQERERVSRYLRASDNEKAEMRRVFEAQRERDLGHVADLKTIAPLTDPTGSAEAFGLYPGDLGYETFEQDFPVSDTPTDASPDAFIPTGNTSAD